MLHRNHFPWFFVLTLLQAAIKVFYFDPKAPRETEGRLQSVRSDGQANLVADMRETREPIKALGTPAPRRWLF